MWVIVPCAGMGKRFVGGVPKQYIQINQKTILEHSLSCFLNHPLIKQIVLVMHAQDPYYGSLKIMHHPKVHCVLGGKERYHSVLNGLDYLKNNAHQDDWVLVHDAARPCLQVVDLNNLIESLREDKIGGILAMPVSDTLKSVKNNVIQNTLLRETLWHALTPQMFRLQVLTKAYTYCIRSNIVVTDDSAAVEHLGLQPKIVPAFHPNPKLTYSQDLPYIERLLSCA